METFVPWALVGRGHKKQVITPLDSSQEFLEEAHLEQKAHESAQDTRYRQGLHGGWAGEGGGLTLEKLIRRVIPVGWDQQRQKFQRGFKIEV